MTDFTKFSSKVNEKIESIKGRVFQSSVSGDDIWNTYLTSFPEGTDPIRKERSFHDCSCCKSFIRNVGGMLFINDKGELDSVWNLKGLEHPYDVVSSAMHDLLMNAEDSIESIFIAHQSKNGAEITRGLNEDGSVERFNHFYCDLPSNMLSNRRGEQIGESKTSYQVLKRGLDEISLDALSTISELIKDNSIYRGQEHKSSVITFTKLKRDYDKSKDKCLFVWREVGSKNYQAVNFKNSVIGTLASDISSGMDLEKAVKSFEKKVAPENYKRPKALITKKMIDGAISKLDDLGLRSSIDRRMAKVEDVSVNNVIFADRNTTAPFMKDSIMELLAPEVKSASKKNVKSATKINSSDFIEKVIPTASSVELMVKNSYIGNFFTLTSAKDESTPNLFKWGNNFAWAYNGDVADSSIKQRVKSAGGKVDGDLRFSLAWYNSDDLDIHCTDPSGEHIYYGNKMGVLDVDMNAGGAVNSTDPVENMTWNNPSDGDYKIWVNNFSKRNSSNFGFVIEVESMGEVYHYSYEKMIANGKNVQVLVATVRNGKIDAIKFNSKDIKSESSSQEHWGVKTEDFSKVRMIMNSPNHWDGNNTGNKHLFFILDGCKNDEPVRGFYNEFLNSDLSKHRKVFEILGSKTKCEPIDEQLSGVGFSTTKKLTALFKVDGRPYEVEFK